MRKHTWQSGFQNTVGKSDRADPPVTSSSNPLRRCCICKELKPLEAFAKDKSKSKGFSYRCKVCNRLRNRAYTRTHRRDRKQYSRDYRKNNRDYRVRELARAKKNRPKRRIEEMARARTNLGLSCVVCGSDKNLERHHPNYNKPLEIVTVCRSCHQRIHNATLTLEGIQI